MDHPIQKRVRGTGLGLPLSKKLATVLGGSVSVVSQLGAGSEFVLANAAAFSRRRARTSLLPKPPDVTYDLSRLPVLVVDDKPEMILMYRNYLASSEFHMWSASNTREAEDALERGCPAAIVLDILLRAESTWALLAKIKNDDKTSRYPRPSRQYH